MPVLAVDSGIDSTVSHSLAVTSSVFDFNPAGAGTFRKPSRWRVDVEACLFFRLTDCLSVSPSACTRLVRFSLCLCLSVSPPPPSPSPSVLLSAFVVRNRFLFKKLLILYIYKRGKKAVLCLNLDPCVIGVLSYLS